MAINIAPKSLDTDLSELMRDVASGKAQLPEFQRSWTWDDNRITGILASLSGWMWLVAIFSSESAYESAPLPGQRQTSVHGCRDSSLRTQIRQTCTPPHFLVELYH